MDIWQETIRLGMKLIKEGCIHTNDDNCSQCPFILACINYNPLGNIPADWVKDSNNQEL